MLKRIVGILLLFAISISFTSCNPKMMEKYGYDPDLYLIPEYGHDEETGESYFVYQGERYFRRHDLSGMFSYGYSEDELVDLAWHYNYPFFATVSYKSTTSESPDFIDVWSTSSQIYAKKSFDLQKLFFVVEDTGVEIEFSKMFMPDSEPRDIPPFPDKIIAKFILYSEKYAPVQISSQVLIDEGVYYLALANYPDYPISDDFMHLLIETGVIADDHAVENSD